MSRGTRADSSTTARRPPPSERRTAVVDAFIDLVLEQGVAPRPEEVAERADVSIASLYRYFTDLDELRRDSITRLVDRFPELFAIPEIGSGERALRIASFAASRLALHETLHPLQMLVRTIGRTDPDAAALVDSAREAMADQIRLHFDAELATLSATDRSNTVAAIAALTSVESWEQYRRTLRRTAAQTRRAWRSAIDRLLPGA